jgi:hypothetical protein
MLKCPIYDQEGACEIHKDCMFLRNENCAIVVTATMTDENNTRIHGLSKRITQLDQKLTRIMRHLKVT